MLQLNHIGKKYEEKTVLEDLTLEIEDGEIIALTGKNGIGKTTLLNIIGGLITHEGKVIYNGIDSETHFQQYIRHVSFLSNESFTYQYLTLAEMIGLIDYILKKSNGQRGSENTEELIELLELGEYKDTLIRNLSLGTRQKVSIVVNMHTRPRIILLDEPFVNLDELSVNNLLAYLREYIHRNQAIMIYSTHSREARLEAFCTKLLHITDSRTVRFESRKE